MSLTWTLVLVKAMSSQNDGKILSCRLWRFLAQKKEDHESAASLGLWWGSTTTLRQRFFAV
ncbi:hypothetical protein ARZXY2_4519 (plasmid) [Arthrobacter sp. ZXY-2]|nr:hypothetical protein ARZXY2_4519 [Arthrobacter sp. ZXY-2]